MKPFRTICYVALALWAGLTSTWAEEQKPPLTLADCLALARQQHPDLRAARQGITAAAADVGLAASAGRPQLDVNTGYFNQEPAAPNLRSYSFGLSLGYSLYNSGRVRAQTRQAEAERSAAQSAYAATEQDVALAVTDAYYDLLRVKALQGVAEERLRQAEVHRDQAQAGYEAGEFPRADVYRAEVEVAAARLALIQARNGVELARTALAHAIGLDPNEVLDVADVPSLTPLNLTLEAAQQTAARQRPELAQTAARIAANEAAVRAARTGRQPDVSLRGDWGGRDNVFPPSEMGWTVSLVATLPLSDGGATRARVTAARAEGERLRASDERLRQNIALEVKQAWLLLQEAQERQAVAEAQVAEARHNLEVAEGRYRVGEAPLIELLDAQTALTAARTNEVEARYDALAARARLRWARGETVEGEEAEP
jgi:outer membrane protein